MRQLHLLWVLAASLAMASGFGMGTANGQVEKSPRADSSQLWIAEPGDTGLNRWDPRQLFEESGEILDWNSKNVIVRRPGAKAGVTIPGDNVVRIEPAWANESFEKIHRAFQERQFDAVVKDGLALVNQAKNGDLPLWQVQVILAEMVDASMAKGKLTDAGKLFVGLAKTKADAKEDLPLLLLATIPLPWGETGFLESDLSGMQGLSEAWMASDLEAVQLLGAAWSVGGAKRTMALEKLESLGRSARSPLVTAYARAQLWRTVPPAEILSDRLPRWISERDKLLVPAQAGPTMLLADRLEKAGQTSLAIPEWLRIATLHSDRYHLATKAIAKAAAALRAAGQEEQADRALSLLDPYKIENKAKNSK